MFRVRPAAARGHGQHGWLESWHTFSFSDYYDPAHESFRALRVMNEDFVAAGQGFGMHGHRDMEILTYVLSGALEHRDSLGNGEILRPGEFQRMSAGTGIRHSEFNPAASEPVHLYQIWLHPRERGLKPSYEQRAFDPAGKHNQWQLVAAAEPRDGALLIQQDAEVWLAELQPNTTLTKPLAVDRHGWLQVLRGQVEVAGQQLKAGDGVAVSEETELVVHATAAAELMWFDLA